MRNLIYCFKHHLLAGLFFLVMMTSAVHATEATSYPFTSTTEAARFQALVKEIRCVVCQNQSIADSNAPLANDLREKVYGMVKAQKSNAEVKDYLVKRYGEFILLEPRFNKLTILLWLFPFLGLTCVFMLLIRVNARQKSN